MKKYLLLCCLFFLGNFFVSKAQVVEWIHSYETVTSAAHGIAYDGEANLYFTGYIRSNGNTFDGLTQNYSYGYEDGLICKADTQGHLKWMKVTGAYSSEKSKFIFQKDDKLTIGSDVTNYGGMSSLHIDALLFPIPTTGPIYTGYVVQLDTAGDFQWLVFLSGNISSMKTDGGGNTYATCNSFDGGSVYKISPSGTVIYGFSYSPNSYNCEITFDADGNAYGAINFTDTIPFMGNLYQGHGATDILLFKLSPSGSLIYARIIGGTGTDYSYGMLTDHSGNILMTGGWADTVYFPNATINGSGDHYFIARLDTAGNLLHYSDQDFLYPVGNASSRAGSIVENENHELFAAINFMDTMIHGTDTLSAHNFGGYDGAGVIAKWDSSFQLKWYRRLAQSANQYNTGHASVFLSNAKADKIYFCGQMNEHLIIEGIDYDTNGFYAAYTGLLRDTTFDFTSQVPAAEIQNLRFDIYPSPSSGKVYVRLLSPGIFNTVLAEIFNVYGEKIFTGKIPGSSGVFDVSSLPGGIYFFKVTADGFTRTQKMMMK